VDFEKQKEIFEGIYDDINGPEISHRGRNEMKSDDAKYLIYGEMSFDNLVEVLGQPGIRKELRAARTFCDMGSGTGRCVIGTSLIFPHFSKIIGVELVKTLCDTAKSVGKKYFEIDKKAANRIKFVNDNFFNVNFSPKFLDLDVIFMHYPMHNAEDLYLKLEEKMRAELKPGALVISGIRRLEDLESFPEIAPSYRIKCHYGNATMYYHKKI
jgi:SAM-dependent methyltransferase